MKIGYARVSTQDQRLNLQLEALHKAGCKRVYREKVTGAYRDRPELNRMLDQLREGTSSPYGNSTDWPAPRATSWRSSKQSVRPGHASSLSQSHGPIPPLTPAR